jgi:hypothetical protein
MPEVRSDRRIRDRRIHRQLVEPLGSAVLGPRGEQAFGEDVGIPLPVRAFGRDEDLAMLFEVHQPIRHGQIVDVEQLAMTLERRRIFAVRIDHDDVPFRAHVADLVHDERRGGRLAGTGRAEQGEVLAEKGVDEQSGPDVLGRVDGPDLDVGAIVGRVDLLEVAARDRINAGARHRIAGDAALEVHQLAGARILVAFPEKVDQRRHDAGLRTGLELAHIGEQPAPLRLQFHLRADLAGHGYARIRMQGKRGQSLHLHLDRRSAAEMATTRPISWCTS